MQTSSSQRITVWALVVFALASLASSQWIYDKNSQAQRDELRHSFVSYSEPLIPSLPVLKILSLGNKSLMADIVWLQTIQYFGAGTPYGKYKSLGSLLDTITQLDPKFEYPYEFGLVVLPFMDQTDMAIKLGERAQKEIPNNGLLSYYLASDYHLYKKDYAKAAKYYQLASTQPGSPTAAKTLAATALGQVDNSIDDRLVAAEFWKTVFDSTSDPDRKELAARWYQQMQDIYTIEKAAIAYKAKIGSFPHTQTDLVQAGFTASEFVSPVGRELILDPTTGKVNFDNLLPQQ